MPGHLDADESTAPRPARDATDYPVELVCEVAGSDGTTYQVRPIRPEDGPRLVEFHRQLSTRTQYRRFLSVHPELSAEEADRFSCVDYVNRLALVTECEGQLVAVGRFDRVPGTTNAEVAFVVADAFQHHGIGSFLLDELAGAAIARGITTFLAETLAENRLMLDVFSNAGFPLQSSRDRETISLVLSISRSDGYVAALSAREATRTRVPNAPHEDRAAR